MKTKILKAFSIEVPQEHQIWNSIQKQEVSGLFTKEGYEDVMVDLVWLRTNQDDNPFERDDLLIEYLEGYFPEWQTYDLAVLTELVPE